MRSTCHSSLHHRRIIMAVVAMIVLGSGCFIQAWSPSGLRCSSRVLQQPQSLSPRPRMMATSSLHRPSRALWMSDNNENDATKSNDGGDGEKGETGETDIEVKNVDSSETTSSTTESLSRWKRIKRRLFPPKEDDGLTFRQRLGKAGLSVALSYGWVSNVSYSVTVSLAWYIFSKRTGLSPMAPGQWKSFLAVYAGFYVFNNIVRPVRFALSVSVSLYFDRVVSWIQNKFRVSKGVAVGLTIFLANVVGTIALMCLGISIAATAAGVPVFPPKA